MFLPPKWFSTKLSCGQRDDSGSRNKALVKHSQYLLEPQLTSDTFLVKNLLARDFETFHCTKSLLNLESNLAKILAKLMSKRHQGWEEQQGCKGFHLSSPLAVKAQIRMWWSVVENLSFYMPKFAGHSISTWCPLSSKVRVLGIMIFSTSHNEKSDKRQLRQ